MESHKNNTSEWRHYLYLNNVGRRLSFECQCGKKYVSFPGLYLHCSKKHDMKISIKPKSEDCIVTQLPDRLSMKYKIKPLTESEKKLPTLKPKIQLLKTLDKIVEEYIHEVKSTGFLKADSAKEENQTWIFSFIMRRFVSFVESNTTKLEKQKSIDEAPQYFNKFVMSMMAQDHNRNLFAKTCTYILFFSRWLIKKGYTQHETYFREDLMAGDSIAGEEGSLEQPKESKQTKKQKTCSSFQKQMIQKISL